MSPVVEDPPEEKVGGGKRQIGEERKRNGGRRKRKMIRHGVLESPSWSYPNEFIIVLYTTVKSTLPSVWNTFRMSNKR